MKKDKIIYWVATGIFGAMMLMSGFMYFTDPKIVEGFKFMGFPDYFRVELGTAKLLGALVLLIPQIPTRVKEWAYAGFGINLIAAAITHVAIDDTKGITMPIILLAILVVSNIYLHKIKHSAV
ncbi:DoxX family protein [Cytophaga hutchinsonii]|jgi:hypothetical protein|uniref:Uncharacterized protein n=1 Tax=Cytophaga hutchinsonii (strain ATCC 33406 / DSM 1761 / CIP 103989 / NBRC 15051 / NCIMB 9469 / D465) TaxID=269798 RepID=A0A6N4SWP7_CYTH3|nr:DoxX family protein [Cytophaga hutchinsonii]ABG60858.1 conserved hypothetical protein [Cytophaga hutchinsonii ATCC 33406]SFY00182.1 DoxX-like family protein [Cytophaga hutchinsonii ATCC 33406]